MWNQLCTVLEFWQSSQIDAVRLNLLGRHELTQAGAGELQRVRVDVEQRELSTLSARSTASLAQQPQFVRWATAQAVICTRLAAWRRTPPSVCQHGGSVTHGLRRRMLLEIVVKSQRQSRAAAIVRANALEQAKVPGVSRRFLAARAAAANRLAGRDRRSARRGCPAYGWAAPQTPVWPELGQVIVHHGPRPARAIAAWLV